jgi:diguanylate cyclase (GGDEF)-like protein
MTYREPAQTFEPQIRYLALAVAALTALLVAAPLIPATRFFTLLSYLPLHTGLEFIAMAVSLMVFGLGWNLRHQALNSHIVLLAAAFLAVAVIDFAHAMTYPGMPSMLGESGPQLTIDFWLAGRAIAALALLAVAVVPVRTWSPAATVVAVIVALIASVLVWWVSIVHGAWLPDNVTPGGDLTAFKIDTEYVLAATYFLAALLMLRRRTSWQDANLHFLAAGAWVLGLAELFFTLYVHPGDLLNVIAHIYKAVAYVMLYRALFVAGVVAPHRALGQKKAELAHLAHYDALTDLPNRVLFREQLEQALKRVACGERLAVLYIDIDEFKGINDSLGHAIGDELLKAVAVRLRDCVRETDLIARLGGDEFAIVQAGVEHPSDVTDLVARMYKSIREPAEFAGHRLTTDASIGIALVPEDGTDLDQLLKNADLAMYEAKASGRRTYRFFEPEMDARVKARLTLEQDLRQAILDGGFDVHYQPVVDLRDNKVCGCEALLRWRHPERGMISPAEFIPVAEDTGLINELGEWVLRTACAEAATWPGDIRIAVNISPVQFKNHTLALRVASALAASGLAAHRLELEITEAVLIKDDDAALGMLHQLRDLGVRIALDDFGTGYSSLSYLQRFPFDKIKIDRNFIKEIVERAGSASIVQAVVHIATANNMTTTAEGVETEQQRELVRKLGCTEMQGYLFSLPRPAEEIVRVLSRYEGGMAVA